MHSRLPPCLWCWWLLHWLDGRTFLCEVTYANYTDSCLLVQWEWQKNADACFFSWRTLWIATSLNYFLVLMVEHVVQKEHLTLLVTCPLFTAAEWDDKEPDGRAVLAGGPHQARLQRRRTVLPGEPSDPVHSLPQRGQCAALANPRPPTGMCRGTCTGAVFTTSQLYLGHREPLGSEQRPWAPLLWAKLLQYNSFLRI